MELPVLDHASLNASADASNIINDTNSISEITTEAPTTDETTKKIRQKRTIATMIAQHLTEYLIIG